MPAPARHSSAGRVATLTMRPPPAVRVMALTAARQQRNAVTKFISIWCIKSDFVVSPTGAPDCRIGYSVSGNTATVLSDQRCTFRGPNETDSYSYIEPTTVTLSDDGTSASFAFNASIFVEPPGGTCSFQETGTHTKQ